MPRNWKKQNVVALTGRFGRIHKVMLFILMVGFLTISTDTFYMSPSRSTVWPHSFSIVGWEISNLHLKWTHLLWLALTNNRPTDENKVEIVEEYLHLARLLDKEKARFEGRSFGRNATRSMITKEKQTSAQYMNNLSRAKKGLRPIAEETVESFLSSALMEEGLGSRFGLIFPPVDIKFELPPTALVTSPRNQIRLLEVVLLKPDIKGFDRDIIENQIMKEHNLSALVDDLSGLATYPTIVSDLDTLRGVLQTSAHEWMHAYWAFRPLGRNYWNSHELSTINETAADLVGRELGDRAFELMGGDLSISTRRYMSGQERNPWLAAELRETLTTTQRMLEQKSVQDAEQYMKERWWRLRLGGYGFRKLNQAYFAFRSRYGESSASDSPIGDQIKELRDLFPDLASFIKSLSGISTYDQFIILLENRKMEHLN